jgi:O-antigen/teichoic acid export membrane protein
MVFQWAVLPADRITSVLNQVAFPIYSQLQDQPERFGRFFLTTVTLVSVVTFPVMLGVLAIADVAIPFLLTPKWLPIISPLRVMACMGMVMSISSLISPAVLAKGQPSLAVKFNLLCLLIMPVGFTFGARWGLMGVCWAWVVLFPVLASIWFSMTRDLLSCGWRDLFSACVPAAVCSISMLVSLYFVRSSTLAMPDAWRLFLLVGGGAVTYLAMLLLAFRERVAVIRDALFTRSATA